jgi:hypothetical protein
MLETATTIIKRTNEDAVNEIVHELLIELGKREITVPTSQKKNAWADRMICRDTPTILSLQKGALHIPGPLKN